MKKFFTVLEYALAALMVVGGLNTARQPVVYDHTNVFSIFFSSGVSQYLFSALIVVLGIGLLVGRWRKKDRLRSHILYVIFVLMVYATASDIFTTGLGSFLWLDSVILGAMALALHFRINTPEGLKLKVVLLKEEEPGGSYKHIAA